MKKTFLRNKLPKKNRYTYFYCVTCCCCRSLADKLSSTPELSTLSGHSVPREEQQLQIPSGQKDIYLLAIQRNYLTETNAKKDKKTRTWTWYHS